MKKLNNKTRKVNWDNAYLLFLAIIIVVSFLFLTPKVSSTIFPQKQTLLLREFITAVQKSNHIDLRKYWEFREFYSPGYFNYDSNGLDDNSNPQMIKLRALDKSVTPQLIFTSNKVLSAGGRTKTKKLLPRKINTGKMIINTPSVIITDNNKTYTIIFLKPVKEARKANGFLQNDSNEDILMGNYWLEITTIQKTKNPDYFKIK